MMTKKKPDSIRGRVDGAPRCPRCPSTPLQRIGAVSACVNCGGVFVPSSEQHALEDALRAMADTAQMASQQARRKLSASTLRERAKCPVCLEDMARVSVGSIDVDACAAHGAFYDRDELVAVQRAFATSPVSTVEAPPVVVDIEAILKTTPS